MAGSVTPKIPEIKLGRHISFSFLFLVLIKIAATTAEVAKVHAKNGIITLSNPYVTILLIYTGIKPQCNPKITKICHVKPTMPPAKSGEKSRIAITVSAISLEPKVATGPINKKPTGKEIINVNIGTKKNFTRSGTILLNSFSHLLAKYTIKITGITVDV